MADACLSRLVRWGRQAEVPALPALIDRTEGQFRSASITFRAPRLSIARSLVNTCAMDDDDAPMYVFAVVNVPVTTRG
jgi:hypothetical protein